MASEVAASPCLRRGGSTGRIWVAVAGCGGSGAGMRMRVVRQSRQHPLDPLGRKGQAYRHTDCVMHKLARLIPY